MEGGLRFHDLRHDYASRLVMNDVSLYQVQKLLGHSSPLMTMRYAHLSPEAFKEVGRILENWNAL